MPILASLIAALVPILFYSFLLWKLDKYDREPLKMIFVHFMWGAIGAIVLGISGTFILSFLTGSTIEKNSSNLIQAVLFAPISEEIAKGLFLLYTVNSKNFDNITDGLVYGGTIGLGFGMTENFMYFISYGTSPTSWLYIVIIRSLFSAVMHCVSTGTFGAFLAISKFADSSKKGIFPVLGLIIATIIHLMWNLTVSFENTFLWGLLFMIALILVFISVFKISLNNEKSIIENELTEEYSLGVIPQNHIKILSSRFRFSSGWIDERIRKLYSRYAIRLAFRKNQYKNSKGPSKNYYLYEVEKYREGIRNLLSSNFKSNL